MENAVLLKNDPFPKNVSDMCRLLNEWRNNYGGQSVYTEENDRVAFAIVSEDKEEQKKAGKNNRSNMLQVQEGWALCK